MRSARGVVLKVAVTAAAVVGCSPALDWRLVQLEDAGATVLFPCRPAHQVRAIALAGEQVRMSLHVCSASGMTWGLASARLSQQERVPAALVELRDSAAANLQAATVRAIESDRRAGASSGGGARFELAGRTPGGEAVREQILLSTKGTWVFQATALGGRFDDQAAETFFDSLELRP